MLIMRWLIYYALTYATTTFSQQLQYQLDMKLEQPIGLDDSELGSNPVFWLHKHLVNIQSISGNEQAVGEFLETYLKSRNYTVERQNLDPLPAILQTSQAQELREQKQRFNLLAYPGEKRQTPVLLSSVSTHFERCAPQVYNLLSFSVFNHVVEAKVQEKEKKGN